MAQPPQTMIYRFLDTVGDGSGVDDLVGNYSASASAVTAAYLASAGGGGADIYRMLISIGDTAGIQSQDYGNITGGLGVGYSFEVVDGDGTQLLDLNDGFKIQTNAGISTLCYDVDLKSWGSGNELLVARWTFSRAGSPLQLEPGYKIQTTLNDDFSGLLSHRFMVQGVQGH